MRRRLLLANSHAESGGGDLPSEGLPPESTSFGFPLYLNITKYSYEYGDGIEYHRDHDDVSEAWLEWLDEKSEGIYVGEGDIDIGDNEIYINGCRVTEVIMVFGAYEIYFKTPPFDWVSIDDTGLYGANFK